MGKEKNEVRLGILIVSVLLGILFCVGVSFALWQVILQQQSTNTVNTACFKINYTDKNEIDLRDSYPISDTNGMKLAPYTFTIENICSTTAYYQINLEELATELKKLSNEYVKVSLNNSSGKILNTYTEVTPTISNATISHKLTSGSLKENEKKSFDLRLWLDENTPASDDVMNATFESKITIIAIQKENLENDFTEENKSLNESFSNKEEIIEFKAVSQDYKIIEESEDNVIYNPLEEPGKEVVIQKTYTIDGTYTMYFKDEVGNVIESRAETTKLDQVAPEVNFTASEYQDGIKVDSSSSSDEKSGIKNYYYKLNENDYIESTSSSHAFTGLSDGDYKVTVRVEDNAGNVSVEKEQSVTVAYEQVYVSSSGSDSTGNGSITKPYATLQRAYSKVNSGGEMILLSNLIATSTTTMDTSNKTVTLKSNGNNVYSINRSSSFLAPMMVVENSNALTTTNVILDGKNINANGSLIEARNSSLYLNTNTTIQNNNNYGRIYTDQNNLNTAYGGGIYMYHGILNINGAIIQNNKVNHSVTSSGGGIAIFNSNLNIKDGKIINNEQICNNCQAGCGGGIIMFFNINGKITGGTISNNKANVSGGGIALWDNVGTSTLEITGGSIENNSASKDGGGIILNQNITMYWRGGIIGNNTAPVYSDFYTVNGAQIIDQR